MTTPNVLADMKIHNCVYYIQSAWETKN